MFEHVVNKNISLRLTHVSDSEEVFGVIDSSREQLKKGLSWVDLVKSPRDCKYSAYKAMHQYASNNGFQCNVIYKNKIVGKIGLHGIEWSDKSTSIGYWLAEDYQGRGIMTTCCKCLLNMVFDNLKLNAVYIYVAEDNNKSRAIPERLNFKQHGLKKNAQILSGNYVNHIQYVMTRKDWNEFNKV
jgi:ribosomal-protein-serine acetyltransferase